MVRLATYLLMFTWLCFVDWGLAHVATGIGILFLFEAIRFALKTERVQRIVNVEVREQYELNALGFHVVHWFMTQNFFAGTDCNGIATDNLGRVAVRWKGEWEGLPVENIRSAHLEVYDRTQVHTTSSRSINGAIVGGVIAGPVGSIIGGTGKRTTSTYQTEIQNVVLVIAVRDMNNPFRKVGFGLDLHGAREWEARVQVASEIGAMTLAG